MSAKLFKIAIAGIEYFGLSIGILLTQNYEVVALDIDANKVEQLNNKKFAARLNYFPWAN